MPALIRVMKVSRPGSLSGLSFAASASASSAVVVGPSLTPIGLRIRDANSTWAPSSCRVRSPIQTKWPDTSYGWSVRESIRVSACSYSRISASWLLWNETRCSSSDSAPIACMKSSARSISRDSFSYAAPTGLVFTKSAFHACICRRSA